jgi:hypothetical protein
MLLRAGEPDYPQLALQTRLGRNIRNEVRPEPNPAMLRASVSLWRERLPNARLRSSTGTYNCIGMIVASRRTWVDPGDLLQILKDDGYIKLSSDSEAEYGDVVVYHGKEGVCHAGLVVGKNVFDPSNQRDTLVVLSKWGQEGEYVHDARDVPALCGIPSEYWTDRKGVS